MSDKKYAKQILHVMSTKNCNMQYKMSVVVTVLPHRAFASVEKMKKVEKLS